MLFRSARRKAEISPSSGLIGCRRSPGYATGTLFLFARPLRDLFGYESTPCFRSLGPFEPCMRRHPHLVFARSAPLSPLCVRIHTLFPLAGALSDLYAFKSPHCFRSLSFFETFMGSDPHLVSVRTARLRLLWARNSHLVSTCRPPLRHLCAQIHTLFSVCTARL